MRIFLLLFGLSLVLNRCVRKQPASNIYTHDKKDYYHRLIQFTQDTGCLLNGVPVALDLEFKTQDDSVFWDSHNNLGGRFVLKPDTSARSGLLAYHVSRCAAGDSGILLIRTDVFFRQIFKTRQRPFFSANDSVVKILFRIADQQDVAEPNNPFVKDEYQAIETLFRSVEAAEQARDISGFYWLERPGDFSGMQVQPGEQVSIIYTGRFLNGRLLEQSSDTFDFIYGTPDQVLKGVNYVIGYLKPGQSAKIILPSRLAFGEQGSSNGTVPPRTPLVYEVTLVDKK